MDRKFSKRFPKRSKPPWCSPDVDAPDDGERAHCSGNPREKLSRPPKYLAQPKQMDAGEHAVDREYEEEQECHEFGFSAQAKHDHGAARCYDLECAKGQR